MARTPVIATGTGHTPYALLLLFCATEQVDTPHSAGRVLSRSASGIHLEVKCRRCGKNQEHVLSQLPEGYRPYQVRVTGEDGPHLPDSMRPIPYLEEEFEVIGRSLQDAHDKAEFTHSLPFAGHLARYYINGELHLNERF